MTAPSRLCLPLTPIVARRRLRLALALMVGLAGACGDGFAAPHPSAPQRGAVRIVTQTSGGDQDLDGYVVMLDGDLSRVFSVNGSRLINDIVPGTHVVSLEMVADNCTVTGESQRSLNIVAGQSVDVVFEIVCAATAIAVKTHTTGSDFPSSYGVTVNDGRLIVLNTNDSTFVSRLHPGAYTVELRLPGDNCSVAAGTRKTVDVSVRTVTPVSFEIICGPPVRFKKIAYAMDTTINGEQSEWIAVSNVDGSNPVRLALGSSPAWSPDGTRLVFSDAHCLYFYYYGYTDCQVVGGVVVMDPETRNVTRLTDGGAGFSPAWSPTADAIAVLRCCDQYGQPGRLFVLGLQGSPPVELTFPNVLEAFHPVWSPDGERIAFTCVVDANNLDLCVVNKNGSGFVRLTSDAAAESDPAWSPDGRRIALTWNADVALFAFADGSITRLTRGREPAWSSEGSQLVFAADFGLATINPDGSNFARLTIAQGQHAPTWRP